MIRHSPAAAALAVATLSAGLALVPGEAAAGYRGRAYHPAYHHGYHYGYHRHRGWYPGYVGAGLATGLALGAIAASSAYHAPLACYSVRRSFVDDWGRVTVRRVRICD